MNQLDITLQSFHYRPQEMDSFDFEDPAEYKAESDKPQAPTLQNIQLTLQKGECVLITGPSGCGKTTLLHTINGIIPEFFPGEIQGNILYEGSELKEMTPEERGKKIGSIFQNPRSQFFNVMVRDELRFGCENLNLPQEEIENRLTSLVKKFEVEDLLDKNIFHLSGGEKQRIACLSIAAMEPDIILYDEPSSNLDEQGMRSLASIMLKDKQRGVTQIISEHRINYLRHIIDRVIILQEGKILQDISAKDFLSFPSKTLKEKGLRDHRDIAMPPVFSLIPLKENKSVHSYPAVEEGDLFIEKLVLRYKNTKTPAVNMEGYTFKKGKIHALVGENGVGKTSFLRALTGIEKGAKGTIRFQTNTYKPRNFSKFCGIVFQDVNHQLLTDSVRNELLLSLESQNLSFQEAEQRIESICKSLDLYEYLDYHPFQLSGGQKQRLALGSVLLMNRPVLILDEPTSGLDLKNMESISKLLTQWCQDRIVLLATHDTQLIDTLKPLVHRLV